MWLIDTKVSIETLKISHLYDKLIVEKFFRFNLLNSFKKFMNCKNLLTAFGLSILFFVMNGSTSEAREPVSIGREKMSDRIIAPSYRNSRTLAASPLDSQRLSDHLSSLIAQGKLDKAAQMLTLVGPQKAAATLVLMNPQEAALILKVMKPEESNQMFAAIERQSLEYGAMVLGELAESNPQLGARLYEAREGGIKLSEQTALNEHQLTQLISATDEEGNYLINSELMIELLESSAATNGDEGWGTAEINALLSSGRTANLFYRKIADQSMFIKDEDKMKVLMAMDSKDAADILEHMRPQEAANIISLMDSVKVAQIFAEDSLSSEQAAEILKEIDEIDPQKAKNILMSLKLVFPDKADTIRDKVKL